MDKQTIHLITLVIAIIGSNAWSHAVLSGRIAAVETRMTAMEERIDARMTAIDARMTALETRIDNIEARIDDVDKRLVIVETSLKANNQYIARVLSRSDPGIPAKP